MNILITGSNGVVSRELFKHFKKIKNIKIYFSSRKKKNINKNIFYLDLKKKINLNRSFDGIIHCASNHPYTISKKEKNKLKKENILMSKNLSDYCNKKKIKKVIFISAINTYGSIKKNIINENYIPNNPSWYGLSKLESEKIFLNHNNQYKCICLRVPGIFTLDLTKNHPLIISIIKKLINGSKVEVYNKNGLFNNIIDTYEIFKISKLFLFKKENTSDIYNLASSKPIKFIYIINYLKKKFNSRSKIININNKQKPFIIDSRKIEKNFNIKISSTLEIIKRNCEKII